MPVMITGGISKDDILPVPFMMVPNISDFQSLPVQAIINTPLPLMKLMKGAFANDLCMQLKGSSVFFVDVSKSNYLHYGNSLGGTTGCVIMGTTTMNVTQGGAKLCV